MDADQSYNPVRNDRLSVGELLPYARSRDSNRSGSVWEGAQSAPSGSDDYDDTLTMLAAEIQSRTFPTSTAVIMEDSPEQSRSTSLVKPAEDQMMLDTIHFERSTAILPQRNSTPADHCPTPGGIAKQEEDSRVISDRMNVMQAAVDKQFQNIPEQIIDGQTKQSHIVSAADTLVDSLKDALQALQLSQVKHEAIIRSNEAQLAALLKSNAELMAKNADLEQCAKSHRGIMAAQEEKQNYLNQQAASIQQFQMNQQQQIGATGQATWQVQHELSQMREKNRHRPEIPPSQRFTPTVFDSTGPEVSSSSTQIPGNDSTNRVFGPRETIPRGPTSHSQTDPDEQTRPNPFRMPSNHERSYAPLPSVGFPNMVVDSCPSFTPNTFQNRKREIKLWIAGQPGATATQLLAKLIHVLPLSVKTESLIYMEQTELCPETRSIAAIMDMLDSRFGRTDSERACAWLTSFTEFKRETQENYKDFWSRFARCVSKLEALGMPTNDKVVFNRAIHALRLPDGQLPIVISALETRPDRFSVGALREITIRMYETHKSGGDSTEVYPVTSNPGNESLNTYHASETGWEENDWADEWESPLEEDVSEIMLEDGPIMLMKPKKPTKPRNTPGIHEASRRGAVRNFSNIPNRKGKGKAKSVRLRCGDPSHHWRDCPHPFREKLDPRFSTKGKGKTFNLNDVIRESPAGVTPPGAPEVATPRNDPPSAETPALQSDGQTAGESSQQASINDVWAQYYSQNDPTAPALINVCHTIHFQQPEIVDHSRVKTRERQKSTAPPPILIDSGASCSVVGEKWLTSWGKTLSFPSRIHSDREFRFGDGPPFPSRGEMNLPITIPKERASDKQSHVLTSRVDVVASMVPLLISQQALTHLQGRIDFSTFNLEIPDRFTIRLTKSSTGHVLLPGIIDQGGLTQARTVHQQVFPVQQLEGGLRKLRDEEVGKIHQQLGHCSDKQLLDLLKFGGCRADPQQVKRVMHKCNCQRSVHRIAPPVVSSWVARFSGEVVAVDVIYPFSDVGPEGLFPRWRATGKIPALLVVDSLTRFISCQILKGLNSEIATQVFMNEWVKHFGKPKRIILDQGIPGLVGGEWESLSHVFRMAIYPCACQGCSSERSGRTHGTVIEGSDPKDCG